LGFRGGLEAATLVTTGSTKLPKREAALLRGYGRKTEYRAGQCYMAGTGVV